MKNTAVVFRMTSYNIKITLHFDAPFVYIIFEETEIVSERDNCEGAKHSFESHCPPDDDENKGFAIRLMKSAELRHILLSLSLTHTNQFAE
jgi:hypothetical protein